MSELSDAMYSSKWFEKSNFYSKDILLLIMATQRQGYLTIGGLADLNMEAVIAVS